ncbi:MAG: macro domain-containing protein [Chloroflexota bacterium]|nr:macro domain-containing protein [Chloroflexota bacterium]MDE2910971.1 macro domain-containing protein [Chloroflexota bacterium]
MINYVVGDLFSSPAQVLVNTVNTVGVMGKGIALTFRRVFPEMFEEYRVLCETDQLSIGDLFLYKNPHKWILNFPTKKHWRGRSRIAYIEAGLEEFSNTYAAKGIRSISFPMLGCQHGGLQWEDVRPVMEQHLNKLSPDINTYTHLYRPDLLTFPDYRKTEQLKQRLHSRLVVSEFEHFWSCLTRLLNGRRREIVSLFNSNIKTKITFQEKQIMFTTDFETFSCSKSQLNSLWSRLKDKEYLRSADIKEALEKTQALRVCSVKHKNLPKLNQPAGYVYIQRQPSESAYKIGHTSNPAQYLAGSSSECHIFPSDNAKADANSLHHDLAIDATGQKTLRYELSGGQITAIIAGTEQERYRALSLDSRICLAVASLLATSGEVQPVLISDSACPTYEDIGLQMIATQTKNSPKQLNMFNEPKQ